MFVSVSYALQTTFNIIGKTRYILLSASVALVNNGVMGYVFIYPLDLGAEGAGIANFISRFFEISIMIFFALRNRNVISLSLNVFMLDLKPLVMIFKK